MDGVFRESETCDPNMCPGVPGHDDCSSPIIIDGVPSPFLGQELVIEGDNICATDDGPPLDGSMAGGCRSSLDLDGEMRDDVWYSYNAERCGTLTVQGCGDTSYDQIIAIYNATGGCPMSIGEELACNDDGCEAVGPSSVSLYTEEGDELLIRVGGWNNEVAGGFDSMPRGDFTLHLSYADDCRPLGRNLCGYTAMQSFFPLKNRYITFHVPAGQYDISAILDGTLFGGVTAVGSTWWANPPDSRCISVVGSTRPATAPDWSACSTIHVTGCPIMPTSVYSIERWDGDTRLGGCEGRTQAKPGDKWWGDCVGSFDPGLSDWTLAQGIVNIDDAVACIKTFQDPNAFNAVHVSVCDLHPAVPPSHPNKLCSINDVFFTILGFQGNEYPGPQIELCPDP